MDGSYFFICITYIIKQSTTFFQAITGSPGFKKKKGMLYAFLLGQLYFNGVHLSTEISS